MIDVLRLFRDLDFKPLWLNGGAKGKEAVAAIEKSLSALEIINDFGETSPAKETPR